MLRDGARRVHAVSFNAWGWGSTDSGPSYKGWLPDDPPDMGWQAERNAGGCWPLPTPD